MAEIKRIYRDDGAILREMIWEDTDPLNVIIRTQQDLEQVVDNNRILQELHPRRSTNKLVARGVPVSVAERAMREQWDERDWAKWLDDPDNAAFRVWPGRVGK